MKKLIFYGILVLQSVIILLISGQYYLIDRFGQEIKLKVNPQDHEDEYFQYMDEMYLDYEILTVPEQKWSGVKEPNYNDKVYVLLKPNKDGIYEIKEASTSKLEAEGEEFLILAKLQYRDDRTKAIHITYDLEYVQNERLSKGVNVKEPAIATWIISPWGQKKLVQVENIYD